MGAMEQFTPAPEPERIGTHVAGVTFEARQDTLARLASLPDDITARLTREPDNRHDRNAIKVMASRRRMPMSYRHIGYIPRDTAASLAPRLDGEQIAAIVTDIRIQRNERGIWGASLVIEIREVPF